VTVPATGALAFGRVCCWSTFNGNQAINAARNISVGFWQNSSGRPSTTQPNFTSVVNTGVSNRFLQSTVGGLTTASAQNITGQVAPDILAMFLRTSPTNLAVPLYATVSGDVNTVNNTSVLTWAGTMAYTGFQFNMNADATSTLCPIVAIDYFRRVDSSTAWIV
jgi:elongation factor P hydroxylase